MPKAPPERTQTDRDALRNALAEGVPLTLRELSKLAGLSEEQVESHLEHLSKSVKAEGKRLQIEPAECLRCGFLFEGRTRFRKPSRCPECRESHISPPSFQLVEG